MADIKILDILDKLNNPMTHASLFSGIGASEAVHFADRLIEALYPETIDNIVEDE